MARIQKPTTPNPTRPILSTALDWKGYRPRPSRGVLADLPRGPST